METEAEAGVDILGRLANALLKANESKRNELPDGLELLGRELGFEELKRVGFDVIGLAVVGFEEDGALLLGREDDGSEVGAGVLKQ